MFCLEDIDLYTLEQCRFFLDFFELQPNTQLALEIQIGLLEGGFEPTNPLSNDLFDRQQPCAHLTQNWGCGQPDRPVAYDQTGAHDGEHLDAQGQD